MTGAGVVGEKAHQGIFWGRQERMSGLIASAKPYRIKAAHRRRRKPAWGPIVQRYYDPTIGRFLSVDPVTANGGDMRHFNRYAYAYNNPYKFTDPDGRCPVCKLGVDFAIEAGIQYATTGTVNVATAAKETLTGALNPMKTVERARDLARIVKGADKVGDAGKRLPDSATVCRGGTCGADKFAGGKGVTLDSDGKLQNVSVNSAPGKSVAELSQGLPQTQVGVTTVGQVRAAGGDVVPSPSGANPNHCTMCGITPKKAEELFTPTIRNPNK